MKRSTRYTIYAKSGSAITPLGKDVEEIYAQACLGRSASRLYTDRWGGEEPFFASMFSADEILDAFAKLSPSAHTSFTLVERLAILATKAAFDKVEVNPADPKVLFIISTTKGNVDLLEQNEQVFSERPHLWWSAQIITDYFKNPNTPVVVSNACISGVAAQIEAARYLQYDDYDYVVVVGFEMLSKFIVSGFQSFKALSSQRCRPFDPDRTGLNLGEAAAAIIYAKTEQPEELPQGTLILQNGAVNNDANHISGPSRTGEGLLRAITQTLADFDTRRIAFLNAHGTATPYNDDMESMAINRAGLQHLPVNSLKGYFGHTLGAAGVLEVLVSARAFRDGVVLPSLGTEKAGTVRPLNVPLVELRDGKPHLPKVHGDSFMKLISGFGGSNAALLFTLKS